MATIITDEKEIALFRLHALRSALKLQILGLKRRGRQASVIVKDEFKMPKHLSLKETLARLEAVITEREQKL